jgi:hypothetical protein
VLAALNSEGAASIGTIADEITHITRRLKGLAVLIQGVTDAAPAVDWTGVGWLLEDLGDRLDGLARELAAKAVRQ